MGCTQSIATKDLAAGKAAFFQKYFEIEGSDAGIQKFQLFKSCGIFYKPQQDELDRVLKNIEVEDLPGTQVKTVNHDFDFQLVFKHVADRMGTVNHRFVRKLGFTDEAETDDLYSHLPGKGKESRSQTMIVLHKFAQKGGRTVDLLEPLVEAQRTDLKQQLVKALAIKAADLSVGSAPKKVKYDSGH